MSRSRALSDRVVPLSRSALAVGGLALAAVFLTLVLCNSFLCDDAFITFRYSRNLAAGHGPVFNLNERVEGYTNFLWMLLMAAVIKLRAAPELWSRVLSVLFSLGTLAMFVGRNARQYGSIVELLLFPAFLALSAPFFVWTTGGLETAAFAFFLFSGLVTLEKARRSARTPDFLISSLLFLAASLTRPEGPMVFGLAALYLLLQSARKKVSGSALAAFLAPFMVLYVIFLGWRWTYYGKLLPNSFYVKAPREGLQLMGLEYFLDFVIASSFWIPLFLALYRSLRGKGGRLTGFGVLLIAVTTCYSLYVILVGGDYMALSRYLMPMLPLIYLLLQDLCWAVTSKPAALGLPTIIAAVFIVFAAANLYANHRAGRVWNENGIDSIGALKDYTETWTDAAYMIRQNSLPSDTIAVTAAGIIPYYTELYTVDILGLMAPDLSKYRKRPGIDRVGHSLSIEPEYCFALRPQFLIGHPMIKPRADEAFGSATMRDREDLFRKYYSPVRLELPEHPGLFLNFWLRPDVIPRIKQKLW